MVNDAGRCCNVAAVVSVDAKGQIVLPKDVRERAGLKPNDKLALIGCERDGKICCIVIVKAEKLGDSVGKMLGPMLKDVLK
jgi:AbrB family looped-hinge helix DNA binding protein